MSCTEAHRELPGALRSDPYTDIIEVSCKQSLFWNSLCKRKSTTRKLTSMKETQQQLSSQSTTTHSLTWPAVADSVVWRLPGRATETGRLRLACQYSVGDSWLGCPTPGRAENFKLELVTGAYSLVGCPSQRPSPWRWLVTVGLGPSANRPLIIPNYSFYFNILIFLNYSFNYSSTNSA